MGNSLHASGKAHGQRAGGGSARSVGFSYVFVMPGEHGEYDLLSYGKDGRPGGEGENADIGDWQ